MSSKEIFASICIIKDKFHVHQSDIRCTPCFCHILTCRWQDWILNKLTDQQSQLCPKVPLFSLVLTLLFIQKEKYCSIFLFLNAHFVSTSY